MPEYVRFESPVANARGTFPGVFALANGLRDSGALSGADSDWLVAAHAVGERSYAAPPAEFYDRTIYPGAHAWFRADAAQLLAYACGYVALLERHGVACVERRSSNPGTVIWSDAVQVVVTPRAEHGGQQDEIAQ